MTDVVITQELPAAPEAMWAAWTEPDRFAQWWVGPGFKTHDLVMDVRTGGRFEAKQSADDGSMVIPFAGFYSAVEPDERLVLGLSDSDDPDVAPRTEMTVILRPAANGTEQEFHQTGMANDEHFAQLEAGTRLFFSQLEAYLQG